MASLRSWLKLQPLAAILVCDYADDDREPRRVKMGEARSKFRDAEMACKGAVRIEALDGDGNTLRLWEAEDAPMQEAAQAVRAAPAPTAPVNSTEQMLTTIARLLVEAGDSAASRQTEVMSMAFQQNAALMNLMSERLAQLENVWQQNLIQRAEELDAEQEALDNTPPSTETPDPNTQLVTTLLQGAVMSQFANGNGSAGKTGS